MKSLSGCESSSDVGVRRKCLQRKCSTLHRNESTYDQWGAFLPEAPEGYQLSIGAENFEKILLTYGGKEAVEDWHMLAKTLRPMSSGIKGIPHTAIRSDAGILLTVALKYPGSFMNVLRYGEAFTESFNLDDLGLKNEFLRNYLDMLAFLLQGLPADQTLKVVMAYMVEDFFKENAVMDVSVLDHAGLSCSLL